MSCESEGALTIFKGHPLKGLKAMNNRLCFSQKEFNFQYDYSHYRPESHKAYILTGCGDLLHIIYLIGTDLPVFML